MERSTDPRANPILGSEVISGQITDKALALFNLLNQVTGSEGDNVRSFNIEGADPLTLALYTLDPDENSHAWSPKERIYFQDNGQRLRDLQTRLRENLTEIKNDITGNISALFELINEPEGSGGATAGDPTKSIRQEIEDIANDPNAEISEIEDRINELLTSETAVNNIVEALFARFSLDVSRLDEEIFNLLDDGDDIYSDGSSGVDSTESTKYFLDFGNGDPAYIANDLDDALARTLDFLESEYNGSSPWDADREVSNYTLGKYLQGSLLLDQGLIDAIIADPTLFPPETKDDDLSLIRTQAGFLKKFDTISDFVAFAKNHYGVADDQATYNELFKHDLAARTPKYYEDQRSLMDMLKGKADASDTSSANFIFAGLGDKVSQAAGGAVQALSGGYDKLATNNFEAFVRDNPLLLIEHLLSERSTATDDRLKQIDKEIIALQEFQNRQLDSFTTWFKEKNKELGKTKLIIDKLTEEHNDSSTSAERRTEIEDKITLLLETAKENDGGLTVEKIRARAAFAITKLQALSADAIANGRDSSAFDADLQNIQDTLLLTDAELINEAIKNGSAIAINRAIARDISDMSQRISDINIKEDSAGDIQAKLDEVKLGFNNHGFLVLEDISGLSFDNDDISDAIDTTVRSPNSHVALYASELLESDKINARFFNRKLPQPQEDGSLPEDNQVAPPQISPTPASAAIAAIGNQILAKANNILHETKLPDETWIDENGTILKDINDQLAADPSLGSAGEIFFMELKEAFKSIIQDLFNSHSGPSRDVDNAKQAYRFVKNMEKDGTIGGPTSNTMDDITAALEALETTNLDDAADLIFLGNYRGGNYFESKGLGKIQNTLEEIIALPLDSEVPADYTGPTTDAATRSRAQSLLNGTSSRIGINNLIDHLESERDSVITDMNAAGFEPGETDLKKRLKKYTRQLSRDFSEALITDASLSEIQTQLNDTLTTTSFDLNNDGINDFQSIQNTIDGIDDIADQVSSVFGEKYDKAQRLTQLKNAIETRRELEEELADITNPPKPERAEEIHKILYGFEVDPDTDDVTIGSPTDLKKGSLVNLIEDLKVDAANILDQSLPTNEDNLLDLIQERKGEFAGIEKQGIKRLILLMFVLSMLEYSDWDYRKQESDPSRYQVY